MPIERRIREGSERNASVLDPDVNRFLDSIVHRTHRRLVIHRSLAAAASVAAVALAILIGPSVLNGIKDSRGTTIGSHPTPSVAPRVTPGVPLLTGMFIRSIPEETAVVRNNGIAGTWTISAGTDGLRLLAPDSFAGASITGPFELQADTLRTAAFSTDICDGLPAGTYRWAAPEGFLVLSVLSDPCDARVAVLAAGTWAKIDS